MKTISGQIIDDTWKQINEATEEDAQELMDLMAKQQPFIVAYLLAVEETLMSRHERGQIILIGVILWQILNETKPGLRQINVEDLEAAEEVNVNFLEELEAGSEMDHMAALQELMTSYNQVGLLSAVIEALMAGNEEEPEMVGEHVGLALLHLKTVIDCLDQ
jgi:hypothetical protein